MRALALAALALGACSVPVDVAGSSSAALDGDCGPPALTVWVADDDLAQLAGDAAFRIESASGLIVAIGDGPDAIPAMWSDTGDGMLGWHHVRDRSEWIAIDEAVSDELVAAVVLHELLHALGADHVEQDAGVLSPALSSQREWRITNTDLEELCAVQDCSRFAPEGQ